VDTPSAFEDGLVSLSIGSQVRHHYVQCKSVDLSINMAFTLKICAFTAYKQAIEVGEKI